MAKRGKPPLEQSWPASKVEFWPLAKIVPYPKNPRVHSDEQISALAGDMISDGVTMPILVDESGVIIAGHGRWLASQKNGFKQYPVVVARGWTEEQKRSARIRDNQRTLQSAWDAPLLKTELTELAHLGYDMPLLGFEEYQLVQFMAAETDPNAEIAPDPPVNPVTRRGDLWICGDHRILCGDATSESDVAACLAGAKPDIANCDPPYGINIVQAAAVGGSKPFGSRGLGRVHALGPAGFDKPRLGRVPVNAAKAIIETGVYAEVIGDDSPATAIAAYKMLSTIRVPVIVLWGGNYYAHALPPSRCWFVWDKEVTGSFADVELAWTNCDQVAQLFRHQWNGLMKASERGEKRVHPTQKPVALAEWVLATAAPKAKSALDLFLGSGPMLIACERKGVRCFGMELAPHYVDCAIERWAILTGKAPILEATGQTFAEVQESRYNGQDDASRGYTEGLAAVRERVAAGGPGWTPGASEAKKKKARSHASSVPAKA